MFMLGAILLECHPPTQQTGNSRRILLQGAGYEKSVCATDLQRVVRPAGQGHSGLLAGVRIGVEF
jgi:hypothetical protein